MTERGGIFAGDDPFAIARTWLAQATESEPEDPNAIALATADAGGLPNVRMVLLKDIEDDAFVFYTNFESAKGQEISASGKAAFVAHWKSLRRQLRVRGTVTRVDDATADAYYRTRALQSRLGACTTESAGRELKPGRDGRSRGSTHERALPREHGPPFRRVGPCKPVVNRKLIPAKA
jgi:pyridoxamine 5'-phosphate oxidase